MGGGSVSWPVNRLVGWLASGLVGWLVSVTGSLDHSVKNSPPPPTHTHAHLLARVELMTEPSPG